MTEESKDCWQCRLTSGGGLMGGGVYVVQQSKKLKTSSRHIVAGIGYGIAALGLLRLLAFPPFKNKSQSVKKQTPENTEHEEYIVGQYPTKFT